MPKSKREVTQGELEQVKTSVESAKVRTTITIKGTDDFKGDEKNRKKELVLYWLGFDKGMISFPDFLKTIQQAAKDEDFNFFIKLGRRLGKNNKVPLCNGSIYDQFLIDHWIDEKDGIPPLFRMSIESIMEAYKYYHNTDSIDEKSLRCRIKFLYLKSINHSRIKVQKIGNRLKIVNS